jgi:RecB family exonuclease
MACPGSVRASEGIPDRPSVYAEEGTAAHVEAARCLRARTRAADPAVQLFVDTVRALVDRGDRLLVEHRVDLSPLRPPVAMFGTADAIVLKRKPRQLHVLDFKFGEGVPVEAENNPQLRYYGLGALLALSADQVIDGVTLTVVQPRAPHPAGPVRREALLALELTAWRHELLTAAHRAVAPEAPLVPGPWCRFCPAQPTCPALRAQSLATAQDEFPATLEYPRDVDQDHHPRSDAQLPRDLRPQRDAERGL